MEMTLFLISLALCFVLTVGQIAPMDAEDTCRFGFQTRAAHDWIPYVNETSDGLRGEVKWQIILDQFDYTSLIEPGSPTSLWQVRDFDGDGITFTTGGGNCIYSVGVTGNSFQNPNTNNWVFTQSVDYLDAIEVYVNASVRFVGCQQRAVADPPCQQNYVTLHRYDRDSPATVLQRTDRTSYQPYLGDPVRSRLVQNVNDNGRIIMKYHRPPDFDFTHFGIQDTGTYGSVERLLVYYRVAQGYEDSVVVCPSVALPAVGSGATNSGMCRCKANATPTDNLARTCDENGVCQESPACDCDPGYEFNSTLRICQGCRMGTYKTSLSNTDRCIPCPGNSMTINISSTVCDCIRNTVRCPNRPDDACQPFEEFFASPVDCETSSTRGGGVNQAGAIAITFFVTLIITAVVTVLVVLGSFYLWKKFKS